MKNYISLLFACLLFHCSWSQIPKLEWLKTSTGARSEFVADLTTDADGNVYTVGRFQNTVDFDYGPGVLELTATGEYDVFVQKLDRDGNLIWAKSFGGTRDDQGLFINIDAARNVYIGGSFESTVDFDPGSGVYEAIALGYNKDFFISKLNGFGEFVWCNIMHTEYWWACEDITADNLGNVYAVGEVVDSLNIVNQDSSFTLYEINDRRGGFIQKLDADGNTVWVKQTEAVENGTSDFSMVCLNDSGDVYITGTFSQTVDFDPGPGVNELSTGLSHGGGNAFVLNLDDNGEFKWVKSFKATHSNNGLAITVDRWSNIFVTGRYYDTVDFDPGPDEYNLTVVGGDDAFIAKLDKNGGFKWAGSIGGSRSERGLELTTDSTGNVYLTGDFVGYVDFDPSEETHYIASKGSSTWDDIFVEKFDADGNMVWVYALGSPSKDISRAVRIDPFGSVYVSGFFQGKIDFDPSHDVEERTPQGGAALFIQKLYECDPVYAVDSVVACGQYTWLDGETYTADNQDAVYAYLNVTPNNCDSIVTLNLTVHPTYLMDTTYSVCQGDSAMIYGEFQLEPGVYHDTLKTVLGCDSILQTTLVLDSLPRIVLPNFTPDTICLEDPVVDLPEAEPAGGIFIGQGVENGYFDPLLGTIGDNVVTYSFTDSLGCTALDSTEIRVEVCLGLGGLTQYEKPHFYPNPVKDELFFNVDSVEHATLMDKQGRVLWSGKAKAIDFSRYSVGIYYLRIQTATGLKVHSVSKM